MQICNDAIEVNQIVNNWQQQKLTIAFVPTMGNLHAGHLALVKQAANMADKVVVSIFVNPLQFDANEDFNNYPRSLDADLTKLQNLTHLVFTPQSEHMYNTLNQTRIIAPNTLTNMFEGKFRKNHFDGVTTIVNKLFNIVQPNIALFGQKDYQQWLILKNMTTDLFMPINMVCAKIIRDDDGLALSSRNQYLTAKQRQIAPILYKVLQKTKQDFLTNKDISLLENITFLEKSATAKLLEQGFDKVDYFAIVNKDDLTKNLSHNKQAIIIVVVARLGNTRLLDNLLV